MRSILLPLLILISVAAFGQSQLAPADLITPLDRKERYLDSLMKMVGNKRIVAIGEDTHGTADFYELRAAITKRLITEKGFNVVILENPHEDMLALQKGLRQQKLDTLMRRHLFSIYQSAEMRDFLKWFAKRSSRRKELRLAGCDDSYREILPQYLVQAAAHYQNDTLNNLCRDFLLRQTLDEKSYYAQLAGPKPDSLPETMVYMRQTYALMDRIDSLCIARGYDDAMLKELIFHGKTGYVYYERFAKKLPVSRDAVMGERINYHAADPSAKIVVWAHSGHIARYAWLADELGLMGATVAKAYPNDYFAIGLSSANGSYSYINSRFINDDHQFTDSLLHTGLNNPEAGSWNSEFAAATSDRFLLDFSKLPDSLRTEWKKLRPIKMLGYGKQAEKGKDYYQVVLPELFDAMIFLRESRHTTAIF